MSKSDTKPFCDFISNEKCPIKILFIGLDFSFEDIDNPYDHKFFMKSLEIALAKNTSIRIFNSSSILQLNYIDLLKYQVNLTENWNKSIKHSDHLKLILKEKLLIDKNIDEIISKYKEIRKSLRWKILSKKKISYCYTLFLHCVLRKFISKDIVKLILGDFHYFVDFDKKIFKTHKKILSK